MNAVVDKMSTTDCRQTIDGSHKYVIPLKPIPLARPRFNGKNVFDSQKKEKEWTVWTIWAQHKGIPIKGPLHFHITFFMRKPKKEKYTRWHTSKPDLSNLIKFYEDVCSGILYEDDRQIAQITASKIYDAEERTEIIITEL